MTSSRDVEWQGSAAPPTGADETSRRLLLAGTAQDVLAAVIDQIAGTADFCLVMQLGRVPGADIQVTAEWGVETGEVTAPGREIAYNLLAPFLEPRTAADGAQDVPGDRMLLRHTTVMTDTAHDDRVAPAFAQILERMRVGSFVAVPMNFQGQTRTALVVGRRRPGEYEPDLVRHYEAIALQAESALRNIVLLQQSQARAAQLEVVAEISSAAASILDLEELLPLAAELICERFHLYYVGIFLLDVDGSVATLRAGTGAAGRQMVEAGHHFAVGGESMIGWCLANRKPRIALDVGREAVRFDNPLLPDTRSELALPLMMRGRLVGAMTVQSTHQAAFDQGDVTVLQVMADQLVNAIETARFFQEREHRMTQMGIVNEIGRALSTEADLNALFAQVHTQVSRLFDANSFFIALYEEGRDFWELAFSVEEGQLQPQVRHPMASGLTGWILVHRTSILFRSLDENLAFHEREGIPSIGASARSWLGVPLLTSHKRVGVMGIQDYQREYVYHESDRSLFETIGAQVATAVDNARLLAAMRQRAGELEVVNEVGRAMTSVLDLDEVLRRLVDVLKERFGYYCVSIALASELGMQIKVASMVGQTDQRLEVPDLAVDLQSPHSLIAECARTARPVVVGEVLNDPRYLPLAQVPDTRSELTVPILTKGQVIGTLDVQSDESFAFDETDVALLQLLASQAGVAIENARLFEQTQTQLSNLAQIQAALAELNAAVTLDQAIAALLPQVAKIAQADRVRLYLIHGTQMTCVGVHSVTGWDAVQVGETVSLDDYPLTKQVVDTGQVMSIAADDPRLKPHARQAYQAAGLTANATIPLVGRHGVVGVLSINRQHPGRAFGPQHVSLAETLANQATMVLEKNQLFEETETRAQQQETLRRVIETVSRSFDVETLLEMTLAQTLAALELDAGLISLYSGQPGGLTLAAQQGVPEPMVRVLKEKGLGGTLCAYMYETGQTISIGDVRLGAPMPAEALVNNGLVAYAGTPLTAKGERIGTMCFFHRTVKKVEDDDLALLAAIGGQVGLGITNVRLFEETERRARELAVLNEMGRVLSTQLDVGEVLENTYHYTSRLMDADNFYIAFYHPETDEVSFPIAMDQGQRQNWSSRRSGNGLTEHVIRTAEPVVIREDVSGYVTSRLGVELIGRVAESWVGAPLVIGPQVLGVIAVQSYTAANLYDERDRDLLMAVASQTAGAVQNARLFEQIEGQARYERALREITAQVRASTNADTIMRTAVRELGAALDRPVFIRLGRAASTVGNGEGQPGRQPAAGDGVREYSDGVREYSDGGAEDAGARGHSGKAREHSREGGE